MADTQYSELQRKNLEAAIKLAQLSMTHAQRIVALQAEAATAMFEDGLANAKALAEAEDAEQAASLRSRYAQQTTQKMMETARKMAAIGNDARGEFTGLLTEQLTGGSKEMIDTFQSFLGALPGQNARVIEAMKQAMDNASGAFEQISKASAAIFGGDAAKRGK